MSKNRKVSVSEIANSKNPKKHRPKPRCSTAPILFRFYHPALWDWSIKVSTDQEVPDGNAL